MRQLRKRIVGLLESGVISEVKEKENLERIINTKNWAPYCLRHSSITCDAETYPKFALRKKVRWSPNSVQPARYIKNRWGDDLRNKILLHNGIINENDARPIPVNADCARCKLINPLENKYCSSCGYPLSVAAYEELKAVDNEELNNVKMQLQEFEAVQTQETDRLKVQLEEKDRQLHQTVEALEVKSKNSIDKIEKELIKLRNDMIVEVTTDNEHGGTHYYKYKKV